MDCCFRCRAKSRSPDKQRNCHCRCHQHCRKLSSSWRTASSFWTRPWCPKLTCKANSSMVWCHCFSVRMWLCGPPPLQHNACAGWVFMLWVQYAFTDSANAHASEPWSAGCMEPWRHMMRVPSILTYCIAKELTCPQPGLCGDSDERIKSASLLLLNGGPCQRCRSFFLLPDCVFLSSYVTACMSSYNEWTAYNVHCGWWI